jgi:hypothetical protein
VKAFKDHQASFTFAVWSSFKVYFVFTDDLVASRRKRYGTAGAAADGTIDALFTRGAGGYGHLFFKKDASAAIITHECCHAIWYLFEWAGVQKWDNETLAYHLGHLVGRVSDFQAKVLHSKNKRTHGKRNKKQRRTR